MVIDDGVTIGVAIEHLNINIVVSIKTVNSRSSQSNNISLKRLPVLE